MRKNESIEINSDKMLEKKDEIREKCFKSKKKKTKMKKINLIAIFAYVYEMLDKDWPMDMLYRSVYIQHSVIELL